MTREQLTFHVRVTVDLVDVDALFDAARVSLDNDPEMPHKQDLHRLYASDPRAALMRLIRPAVLVEGVPGVAYRESVTSPPD
ncbi:MAG: hypothetical protein JWO88_3750 [Frankiales bacterium]|nr:hypothetical protein [Frankiales bacterium]